MNSHDLQLAERPPASEAQPGERMIIIGGAALGVFVAIALLIVDVRITLMMAAMFAAILIALRYPFAAVLIYIPVAVIQPEELGLAPVFLHLQRIFAVACAVAILLPQLARARWHPYRWQRVDWALVALLGAACAAVPLSVSRPWALRGCYELAKLIFLYAIIRYTATSVPRMRGVVVVMILATVFSAAMAIRAHGAGQVYIGEHGVLRVLGPTSTTGDPNSLANALVAALPFAVLLLGAERNLLVIGCYLAAIPLFLYGVALTGARGAAVSLLAVIAAMIAQSRRKWLGFALAIASVAIMWSYTPPDLKARYLTLRTYHQEATYQGRMANLRLGLQMFLDRPLTGYGVTCFRIARVEEYDGRWSDAHNLFAQVAGEMGLLGLAAFTWFLAATFGAAWRGHRLLRRLPSGSGRDYVWLDRLAVAIIIMLFGLLVQAIGSHSLLRWHFYVGAALAANLRILADAASGEAGETE